MGCGDATWGPTPKPGYRQSGSPGKTDMSPAAADGRGCAGSVEHADSCAVSFVAAAALCSLAKRAMLETGDGEPASEAALLDVALGALLNIGGSVSCVSWLTSISRAIVWGLSRSWTSERTGQAVYTSLGA